MQAWLDQVLRRLGGRSFGEIRLRADQGETDVGPDAHGDHVLGDLLAEAHARVITLGDDVGEAIVDDDLDLDVRVLGQELGELRPEYGIDGMVAGRDANRAGGLVAKVAQGLELGLDLLEPRAHGVEQALARRRRRDAARGAGQEPHAQPGLHPANGVAQRRLGNAELGRGLGEAALARDRHESQEIIEIAALHS